MTNRITLAAALVFTAVLAVPATLRAETIDFRNVGLYANVSISVRNSANTLVTSTVAAGELNWRWLYGTPEGFTADFYSYCVDALNYLRDPQVVAIRTSDDLSTAPPNRSAAVNAGAKAAWLFNTYAASVHLGGSNVAAAALQVAIWEALYDSSADLAGGAFRLNTTGAVRTQATTFLNNLYGSNYVGASATWLDSTNGQDQITHGVPEPSTLLLIALGGVLLRRRTRKA